MNAERRPRSSGDGDRADATNVGTIVEPDGLFEVRRTAYGAEINYAEVGVGPGDTSGVTAAIKLGHQRMAQTVGAESWLNLAEECIDLRVAAGRTVTADDLHAEVGTPPTAGLPAVALKRAKLRGLIRVVEIVTSTRTAARGHTMRVWGPRA